jgi:hypothetical protein
VPDIVHELTLSKNATNDAEHQRPMPLYQNGEGLLVPLETKPPQQLAIAFTGSGEMSKRTKICQEV